MDTSRTNRALAGITESTARAAERSLAARLVRESAGHGEEAAGDAVERAVRAVTLLESAAQTRSALLDSGAVRDPKRGPDDYVARRIRGAWLLGRASEVIAGCGDEAARLWAESSHALVRSEILEFEDLYDAGRRPSRYLHLAAMRTGRLMAVAVRLGAVLAKRERPTPEALDEYGRELGIALEIRDDVAALNGEPGRTTTRPGPRSGRYTLPVLYALESDPELAGSLGKPLDSGELVTLIDRVRSARGLERAEREATARARAAAAAVSGAGANGLLEIADEGERQ